MRVLIVDDSPQVASTLEIALSHAGWETAVAHDVAGALEMVSSLPSLDAVVTDLDMPRMDGYALIAALRAHPCVTRAAVVVTSGSTASDVESQALAAGANAFFSKPYSPAAVRQTLERLVNGGTQAHP
ncbi:MAG: response regulator [Acidobacteria bacterium]|nr:response regulator [Acidobacteriota bacterium]